MTPVVELRIWGVRAVVPALWRMATGLPGLRGVPGLRFAKQLGTGSGESFAPRDADPRHWALLTVWDDAATAEQAETAQAVRRWDAAADECLRLRLTPLGSRGLWSGVEPFGVTEPPGAVPADGPVAALTRARLRPTTARSFRQAVPAVARELTGAEGLRLAIGIGEAPVLLQGTFSVWSSATALQDFAHRSAVHRDAIRRTGPSRWYAEELFARFAVTELSGHYRGRTP